METSAVVRRKPSQSSEKSGSMAADATARDSMDQCIDTIRTSGRSSLTAHEVNLGSVVHNPTDEAGALADIQTFLNCPGLKCMKTESAYVLLRDNATSFVYLHKEAEKSAD